MDNRPPAAADWLAMFLVTLIWGASFFFIKHSVQIFTPIQMAMWRMVLATVVYLPIALVFWKKIDWKRWKPLAVVAFFGSAIPNFFFAVAQQHVDSSLAGVLNSLTPLFTLVLGSLFFQMKFTRAKVAGVLIGLAGAALLILFNGQHTGANSNAFYATLCVLATAMYAINANTVGAYLKDMHPAAIASSAFMITGWIFIIGMFLTGGWTAVTTHPDGWKGLGYVFYLSALGTVVGSILYYWILQRTSTIFATSVTYLVPIMTILIGLFDGETITPVEILGTAVILTGLYLCRK